MKNTSTLLALVSVGCMLGACSQQDQDKKQTPESAAPVTTKAEVLERKIKCAGTVASGADRTDKPENENALIELDVKRSDSHVSHLLYKNKGYQVTLESNDGRLTLQTTPLEKNQQVAFVTSDISSESFSLDFSSQDLLSEVVCTSADSEKKEAKDLSQDSSVVNYSCVVQDQKPQTIDVAVAGSDRDRKTTLIDGKDFLLQVSSDQGKIEISSTDKASGLALVKGSATIGSDVILYSTGSGAAFVNCKLK